VRLRGRSLEACCRRAGDGWREQILEDVLDGDRLRGRLDPRRADEEWEALDERADQLLTGYVGGRLLHRLVAPVRRAWGPHPALRCNIVVRPCYAP
jgi:hypothetical protein